MVRKGKWRSREIILTFFKLGVKCVKGECMTLILALKCAGPEGEGIAERKAIVLKLVQAVKRYEERFQETKFS